jgi:hypothetical protein
MVGAFPQFPGGEAQQTELPKRAVPVLSREEAPHQFQNFLQIIHKCPVFSVRSQKLGLQDLGGERIQLAPEHNHRVVFFSQALTIQVGQRFGFCSNGQIFVLPALLYRVCREWGKIVVWGQGNEE